MKCSLSIRKLFSYYFVPFLVTAVSINQLTLSNFGLLAPSEGGGFGMFATIDSPETRFLKVEALDLDGNKIEIDLAYGGTRISAKFLRKLKSSPDKSLLEHIGKILLNSEFVYVGRRENFPVEQIRYENLELNADILDVIGEKRLYRFASKEDIKKFGDDIVNLKEARLQMWTIGFDQNTKRALTLPVGEQVIVTRK